MSVTAPRRYPKDAANRRKRGHRTPTKGKFFELDEELDIAILTVLAQNRFARTRLLYELLPPEIRSKYSYTTFQHRLTRLYHETNTAHGGAYIEWPKAQRHDIDGKPRTDYYDQGKYRLAPAGRRALEEREYDGYYESDLVASRIADAGDNFDHAMGIWDFIALIRIGINKDPSLRFISLPEIIKNWIPAEIKAKADNPLLIPVGTISHTYPKTKDRDAVRKTIALPFALPDYIFGIEYTKPTGEKVRRFFPLEYEHHNTVWRFNLHQPSTLKKILAYREIIRTRAYDTHLGLPNFLPIFLAESIVKTRHTIQKAAMEATKGRGSDPILFKTLPQITGMKKGEDGKHKLAPLPDFFTAPCLRAGRDDFYLCDLRNDQR